MASVLALIILIVLAYFVVVAGGIAFETTGMDREMARFQALSAFTGVGFTTTAAEQVVEHKARRRIASILIVMGWAGAASVLATLIRSLYVDSAIKGLGNVALGLAFATLVIMAVRSFSDEIVSAVRRVVMKRVGGILVPQEDLLRVDGGLGLSRIEIPENSRVLGVALKDLDLRRDQLSLVLVERHHHALVPDAHTILEAKDHVVLFGRLEAVQHVFGPADGSRQPLPMEIVSSSAPPVGDQPH